MRRTTASERLHWPWWLESYIDEAANTVWLEVVYQDQQYRWPVRRGEADTPETLHIAHQIRAGMIERERQLGLVTARLIRK